MLGVLAIMGVVTVMGITGYSQAMNRAKRSQFDGRISDIVQNVRDLYQSQSLPIAAYIHGKLRTIGVNMTDPWGEEIKVYTNAGFMEKSNDFDLSTAYFAVVLDKLSPANCSYVSNTCFIQSAFRIAVNNTTIDPQDDMSFITESCSREENQVTGYWRK
jgi:type II secretory pathway pseudopilin PulG